MEKTQPEWELRLCQLLAQKYEELYNDWSRSQKGFANGWSISPWTFEFKKALNEIAGDTFECRSSIEPSGEFLWDVSWFKNNEVMPEMVCEIEWGADADILYDFKKLLATNSSFAVMIFGSDKKAATKLDFEGKIDSILKHVSLPEARRFIFIYASATGAVDKGEPRIHAQSRVGNEIVFEESFK
jgi:hypothetical protein